MTILIGWCSNTATLSNSYICQPYYFVLININYIMLTLINQPYIIYYTIVNLYMLKWQIIWKNLLVVIRLLET